MSRALLDELPTAHPISRQLPAILQDDELILNIVGALDTVLAPIFLTLDNLDAYFDPMLAPDDFVQWLAEWMGLLLDETWPIEFTRAAVASTADLYRWRGTARGIREVLEMYTGVPVTIAESGGATWSSDPDPIPPGSPVPALTVGIPLPDLSATDVRRLDLIIGSLKPAHIPHQIELIGTTT
ncbi:MAG TPA: phage tail protein [Microthrixaceae bacterium]|nr:hypothetical protein [Microthrixaceae bacterium]HNI35648.1 phage tail protein [Microthrixaceae bacterium]